jgi:hypothetical protein
MIPMRSMFPLRLSFALGGLLLAGAALAFPDLNDAAKKKDAAKPILTDAAVKRLTETEKALAKPDEALAKLHQEAFKTFALREGFGMERMIRALVTPVAEKWASEDIDKEPKVGLTKELEPLHGISALTFLRGATKAGAKKEEAQHMNPVHTLHSIWRLSQIDLVGLVKNPQPTVYISPKNNDMLLPAERKGFQVDFPKDMQNLKNLKTRAPDEFELAALDSLSQGEDLFVRQKNREIRMVGSLRAVGQCASCHDAERGTMLGAFSYRLVRR